MKDREYIELRLPRIFFKTLPVWMVISLIINSTLLIGVSEYYFMKKSLNKTLVGLAQKTKSPEELVQILKQHVIPQTGFTLSVTWGDLGKQLLDSGVIDLAKFKELFKDDPKMEKYMQVFLNTSKEHMRIDERNSRFMVNTLWAVGLVNKSVLLDEGDMQTKGSSDPMKYASTGGWDLGSRPTSELYSSTPLVTLSPDSAKLVKKIAESVYRPCCDNPTSFPDCNHGMAALGYIELAVKQGVSEKQIYKDLLVLNSFWFPQNYVELAIFMNQKGTEWRNVDAKLAFSSQYSSAQGAQQTRAAVQSSLPGVTQGGGCSA